jgi:hypothetical protein
MPGLQLVEKKIYQRKSLINEKRSLFPRSRNYPYAKQQQPQVHLLALDSSTRPRAAVGWLRPKALIDYMGKPV